MTTPKLTLAGPPQETPTLLTPEQVAARLQVPVAWVYRRSKSWPFTRKISHKMVRFDPEGFEAWLTRTRPPRP